jgi:hypothetical protein
MSAQQQTGFGQFIPGFDFLQQLAKGGTAAMPQMPNLSSWVAPTLNVEELDKRIGELKAVQFWLEQNTTALSATIQALEVQKMTLATLKGMNVQMADLAQAMKVKPAAGESTAAKPSPSPSGKSAKGGKANGAPGGAGNVVDPLQWWGALTQQFQEIATNAMQEVAAATEPGKRAAKSASAPAGAAPRKAAGKPKRTARKSAA